MDGRKLSLVQLQTLGAEIGFDAIGSTSAADFPELLEPLQSYANRGLTGFEHANIKQRLNPKGLLPSAKSIVVVALSYLTEVGHDLARQHPRSNTHGQMTVYSYGEDYHAVLDRMLKQLAKKMEEKVGHSIAAVVAVDTSPLVDRRVAERAGIGWVGKNCMFYTAQHGSFVFLGALLVDIEIERGGSAVENMGSFIPCGDCVLCLKACPTQALLAPGVIDAKRCLSYITQMKGIIPVEFRKALGKRIWGCDTCQWACPKNKTVAYSQQTAFTPHGEMEYPELVAVLEMTNRTFRTLYGHTAAAWRGLTTWKRNALIALGNSRNLDAALRIAPFIEHERMELRSAAAWALQQLDPLQYRGMVKEAYEKETNLDVRVDMAWAVDHEAGRDA